MSGPSAPSATLPRWQRTFLPVGLLAAPDGKRSARDWVIDAIAFVFAVGFGVLAVADGWPSHSTAMRVVDVALGAVSAGLLWLRRTHPASVGAFVLLAAIVSGASAGAAVVVLFNAAIRVRGTVLLGLSLLACAAAAVYPLLFTSRTGSSYLGQLVPNLLLVLVVLLAGLLVRVQRQYVATLHERATRLEAEQLLHVEAAREAERRRIAREMHDVLAHRISLLSVHAGALEFRPDASPEEISQAAGVIRANARAALEELRAVVGVLREDGVAGAPEPPQPTLAQVPTLVEESRAAGMRVRWASEVAPGTLVPDVLGRTAYRIVQEGLTNARRHAPGAAVDVALRTEPDGGLLVEVVSRAAVQRSPVDALPSGGTGLIGLTERVALAGGVLEHGPDATGDFVLRAVLPVAG